MDGENLWLKVLFKDFMGAETSQYPNLNIFEAY